MEEPELPPLPEDGWVSVAEAATHCGVSPQAILKSIRTGRIPGRRFARDAKRAQWMIRSEDLEAYAAARTAPRVEQMAPSALVDTANTALSSLEASLAESRGLRARVERLERELARAGVERDKQVTLALDAFQQLEAAQAECLRLRRAHEALLAAHMALLGTEPAAARP